MPELLPDGPIDTLGVLAGLRDLPAQLTEAAATGPAHGLPGGADVDAVVLTSPGLVAGAAEMAAALAGPVADVPVVVHAGGPLPAFVAARTLVVVSSVDDDPEALRAAHAAVDRGAACVAVAPVGSDLASAGRVHVPVSTTAPVPRLATAPLCLQSLQLLEQLGMLAEVDAMAAAAIAQLERRRDELVADASPALRLARRIGRTLPIVYGADALGGVAARAWKRSVNLGAKAASFAGALPGLGWDEVSGWGQHGDMTRQVFSLVTLRHDHEDPATAGRMPALEELLDEVVHDRHEVVAAGQGLLAQLLDLVYQGELTAWHLAQELEIDPGPSAAVTTIWSDA